MSAEMQTCPSCSELVPVEYTICVWCGFDLTAEHIRRAGITIGNRDAMQRMQRVVTKPLEAFREISLLPDLRGGKMIFYGIAVMMTLNMLAVVGKINDLAYNDGVFLSIGVRIQLSNLFVLNLIYLILQPVVLYGIFFIVWKLSARVLSSLSKTFGGRGDREKIRAMVGYSMLPVFFSWTIAWLLRLLTPGQNANGNTYDAIETAVVSVAEEGFGVVSMVFLWIGWIWATILGIIGMKNVGRLSWVEAVIVAGVPYGIFITIAL